MPATQLEHHHRRRRRRQRRSRLARFKARVDAVAFFVVLAVGTAVFTYWSRATRVEPRQIPPANRALRPGSVANWGDCAIVKTACLVHQTPFVVVGVGTNKCEMRFVCSAPSGEQVVTGVCTTVGEADC